MSEELIKSGDRVTWTVGKARFIGTVTDDPTPCVHVATGECLPILIPIDGLEHVPPSLLEAAEAYVAARPAVGGGEVLSTWHDLLAAIDREKS